MRIVIGYDGTPESIAIFRDLEMAGLPPEAEAAILVVLPAALPQDAAALDPIGSGWPVIADVPAAPTAEQFRRAEEIGGQARNSVMTKFPGWKVTADVLVADAAQALLEKADAWKADLIIVGSHGWTWLGRVFLGSVAQKVLTHAKVSVRLARPRPGSLPAGPRILAAVDGSRDARLALEAIARRNWPAGTRVRLIAAKASFPWADALAAAERGGTGRKAERGSWTAMERILEEAREHLAQAGFDAEWEILEGDPRFVILSEAEAFRADSLFLGRRGLSRFDRLLIGSVSSDVASHAHCSVEVVRRPVRARAARALIAKAGSRRYSRAR